MQATFDLFREAETVRVLQGVLNALWEDPELQSQVWAVTWPSIVPDPRLRCFLRPECFRARLDDKALH